MMTVADVTTLLNDIEAYRQALQLADATGRQQLRESPRSADAAAGINERAMEAALDAHDLRRRCVEQCRSVAPMATQAGEDGAALHRFADFADGRCPDASFDDVAAPARAVLRRLLDAAGPDEEPEAVEAPPKASALRAFYGYLWAVAQRPELLPDGQKYSRALHKWLIEAGADCPAHAETRPPANYDSWRALVREGRRSFDRATTADMVAAMPGVSQSELSEMARAADADTTGLDPEDARRMSHRLDDGD